MAVAVVNQYAGETGVVHEKLRLRLEVVWLWNPRRYLTVMLPPSARLVAEAHGKVVAASVDDCP